MFMPMKSAEPEATGEDEAAGRDRRAHPVEEDPDEDRDDDSDNTDRAVLAEQIGLGAFLDRRGNSHHPLVAGGGSQHLAAGKNAVQYGDNATANGNEHDGHENVLPLNFMQARACAQGQARPMWRAL
jgi:hypothetical protein